MPVGLRSAIGFLGSALLATAVVGQNSTPHEGSKPFTVEDLVRLKRLTDPEVSPDGRYVAYVLRETDMDVNKGRTDIWLLDLGRKGAQPQRLTTDPANDSSPRWAPDSRTIYFLSTRSGQSQVWRLAIAGGEATRVTDYPLDIDSLKVSPRGDVLAVSMAVLPECTDLRCTKDMLDARGKDKATGRIYDKLFIRHWDAWSNGTRSHLFAARLNAAGTSASAPVDLSKSLDADVPSKPFGGDEDFAFSPDAASLVFSARIAGRTEPWSTNFDLFRVAVDGSAAPQNLTANNPAWDAQPVFLHNGDLAWLAMDRPGFEADRFHIMLKDAHTGATRSLTQSWDRSVSRLSAAPDGRNLLATADETGQAVLYLIDVKTGQPRKITGSGEVGDYAASQNKIVFSLASLGGPADLYLTTAAGGAPRQLTQVNRELLAGRQLSDFEQFSFKGWNDETVYGYVMKPYGFEPGKRYPVAFVVHGGPQASFQNIWSYRWNAQAFAGGGYAVVMIDFHGSPGYGQAFTDSISRDWGGKPLVDLQKGLAAALAKYDWLEGERACALGASYGGFMMNWIEGNWPDRFRCIVNHDGLFDQRMMYYATDELWFTEWENGGTQYDHPEEYEKFNPVDFVSKWHTPMLIIHGEQDFRIPYPQGIAAFTALQRRNVESKLVVFPDENHWVLKPANSILWYHSVLGWLDDHLKK
ncbi:MAG: peptidase [Gammaproteobacteria bacterium]|nr:peptidase [Gammaproteobacteria bacterium]